MDRWTGKVALITGGSAGIGAALVERLVSSGMKVVAAARNVDQIKELRDQCRAKKFPGEVLPVKCDVRKEEDIYEMFKLIKDHYGLVHVCVNNAGLGHNAPLLTGNPDEWRELWEVNVHALCVVTKEAIKMMRENHVDDGHVIHISSMSGHRMTDKTEHFYAGTKNAVKVITEGHRRELRELGSHIRVTSISPGNTSTEFIQRMYSYDKTLQEKMMKAEIKKMESGDIVDAIIYALSAPPHVQVHDILIRPVEQVM